MLVRTGALFQQTLLGGFQIFLRSLFPVVFESEDRRKHREECKNTGFSRTLKIAGIRLKFSLETKKLTGRSGRQRMNYRDASIRGIGDFACGDQLAQLDRGRTESPARSIFAMQSIAV